MTPPPIRLLLLEDNPGDARLVREALAEHAPGEFAITTVERLADALGLVGVEAFDAVLCDLGLPDSAGLATAQAMLAHAPAVPLIVLTGSHDQSLGRAAIGHGAQDFLVKGKASGELIARALRYSIERKRLEAQLRVANQALSGLNEQLETKMLEKLAALGTIFEGARDGILVAGAANKKFVMANGEICRMLGYTREEILRIGVTDIHPRQSLAHTIEQFERVLRGEIQLAADIPVMRKDGSVFYADIKATPLRVGGEDCLLGIFRDITRRKMIEQEIHELNDSLERRVLERTQQLEEANRAKSVFLANMSHELRTPLNSIIGFSEMLKDGVLGALEPQQRAAAHDIYGAGTHLLALINDILDLSKVEAGALRFNPQAVDLVALLKSSTLVVREQALAHSIRLGIELDAALGAMLTDERKLKQIVYNLLSNAVKFTPDGGAVTLRARRCARAEVALDATLPGRLIALPPGEDGEFLAITVEDNGIGIAEEHLPKLFEPFTQIDESLARREGGTGLGLSLVRRLAELHGGTVGVVSSPGSGSRFHIWLPYRTAAVHGGATAPSASPLALVIEDDDRTAALIEAQLRAEGFVVIRAATAEEGLERAAKSRPQLITLDIFLPAMDGWEFMRRLSSNPQLADTPVVIISVAEDLARGFALGARRVLQKPFARKELQQALAGLLEARPDGGRARVLVVDDNAEAAALVATILEAEGYRVMRAYGGAEAIEAARRTPPDLVILDLLMPEVSGFEVAHALRASELTARIPILVLTAKDLSAEECARLNGNASAILAKSNFNRDALLAELRRATGDRRAP